MKVKMRNHRLRIFVIGGMILGAVPFGAGLLIGRDS